MHRHCLRSALSHYTEAAGKNCLQTVHRTFFSSSSSSSSILTSTPDSVARTIPSNDHKARKYKGKKKIPIARKRVHRNPGTAESVPKPIVPKAPKPNVPTPPRGISVAKALRSQLLKEEARTYVDDKKTEMAEEIEMDDEGAERREFTPGTFVELRMNERAIEAIVLTEVLDDQRWRVLCLTSQGEIMSTFPANVHFAIPNVISADLAQRCGKTTVVEGPQALNARVEALKQMRLVSIQAEQAAQGSRMWARQKIANIYDEVKSPDPTRWTTATLEHATALLYTDPGFINYYATHKYLMDRPLRYIADAGYLRTQTFRVRPQRDVEEIEQVKEWIANYRRNRLGDGPYNNFIAKARCVVEEYEKDSGRKTGPMTQAQASFAWSRDDQLFLRFLLRSLQQHKSNQLDPYQVGRNTLMKAILPRGPEVTDSLIHELMIKLRTIAPWQDLHALSPVLNPTGDFETPFPLEAQGKAILSQSSSPKPIAGAVLGPLDLRPSDPLDSVRHDFGDLRVFVIDDPTAQELDDGVSVERIPSEPENHWVHIHVADPARILHPGHALCHLARKQFSSFYFGPANYPMFPKALMHDPKFGLSLTDSSMTEEPNRVLTFSIKLDGQANILDYKLRAGILRNVRKTSYQDVDLALGYSTPQKGYPFGGSDAINPGPPLNDSDVADLRILQKLADDQVLKRFRQGIFSPIQGNARVEWKTTPPINIRSPSLQGSVFQGFPEMEYVVSANDIEDCGSHNLVSEMMKLASRVASRVALDNNVPIIRRALDPSIFASEVDVDELLKLRTPHGYIAGKEFVKICAFSTSGRYTLLPKQHAHIGIPEGEGYSRATSPLRRYLDLVSHWQLHHILLGPNAPPRPPFGVDELEKLAVEAEIQEPLIRRMHKANDYFYALMYIKRFAADTAMGVERPFGDPLASVKAWTMQLPKKNPENKMDVKVYLPDLGIQAHMPDLPAELHDMPLGTNLQVKIKTIEMGLRRTRLVMDLAQDLSTIG